MEIFFFYLFIFFNLSLAWLSEPSGLGTVTNLIPAETWNGLGIEASPTDTPRNASVTTLGLPQFVEC